MEVKKTHVAVVTIVTVIASAISYRLSRIGWW
jgi:hypothetical protein